MAGIARSGSQGLFSVELVGPLQGHTLPF
jgi:hypothetical protein